MKNEIHIETNLNLVVVIKDGTFGVDRYSFMDGIKARDIDLQLFVKAEQMTSYEFSAYETVGDAELDQQGVQTLYDLFGTEWADAFFKRKNSLLAKHYLVDLYTKRDEINREIAELEAQL